MYVEYSNRKDDSMDPISYSHLAYPPGECSEQRVGPMMHYILRNNKNWYGAGVFWSSRKVIGNDLR